MASQTSSGTRRRGLVDARTTPTLVGRRSRRRADRCGTTAGRGHQGGAARSGSAARAVLVGRVRGDRGGRSRRTAGATVPRIGRDARARGLIGAATVLNSGGASDEVPETARTMERGGSNEAGSGTTAAARRRVEHAAGRDGGSAAQDADGQTVAARAVPTVKSKAAARGKTDVLVATQRGTTVPTTDRTVANATTGVVIADRTLRRVVSTTARPVNGAARHPDGGTDAAARTCSGRGATGPSVGPTMRRGGGTTVVREADRTRGPGERDDLCHEVPGDQPGTRATERVGTGVMSHRMPVTARIRIGGAAAVPSAMGGRSATAGHVAAMSVRTGGTRTAVGRATGVTAHGATGGTAVRVTDGAGGRAGASRRSGDRKVLGGRRTQTATGGPNVQLNRSCPRT